MKKTYINPNMKVIAINYSQQILAESNVAIGQDTVNSFGSLQGREFDFDDEEEY